MPDPRIAIVGGADPSRNDSKHEAPYKPPVDVDAANAIAANLGTELARRRYRLIVYHSGASFIEAAVVSAYVQAAPDRKGAIIVRQPQSGASAIFPEEKTHPKLFERRVDASNEWEVSFYRSIADADGLVLIGGGYSTLVAGQVAIGARMPVLALEKSGGAAEKVWKTLSPGVDLPTLDEHARMAHPPSPEAAASWVNALADQQRRRYAVETGPIRGHAIAAAILFVVGLVLAFSGLVPWVAQRRLGMPLLLASTLLAGGAGAAIRMVFERRHGAGPLVPPSMAVTLALGSIAGAVAGLLYLVAQPGELTLEGEQALRLASIVAVVSVVGGLTAESVFRKLLGIDVVRSRSVETQGNGEIPGGH